MLGLKCELQPPMVFFLFSPETAENPNEKFTAKPTGALAGTAKNSTGKPNFLSPYRVPSQLSF